MPRKTVYNNLTSLELITQISKENQQLLDDFLEYCKSTSKSPNTIDGYKNDSLIFFCWNLRHNENKFFIDLTKRDVMKYQGYLVNDLKLSPNRVRRLKSSLSSMSNFIERIMDDIHPNFKPIINKVPAPPKKDIREKTVLEDEQIEFLLNYLIENKKYQMACCLALAVASGSRKSELLRFKVSYFTEKNIIYNALYKTPEKIQTKGRSLGKYIYRYVLVKQFKPYFDSWMEERERLGITGEELFGNKRKGEWCPATITLLNSWALTFSKMLNTDFYFHSARHKFCTDMCKANVPASIIKDIIGWENVSMIDVYNDTEVDDEVGKYFDENGIKVTEKKSLSDL